eukprot:TRINITY_DN2747_c0_g1_i14.p2 TRINITY_DN2747_c0_g1~~TRINITY_DN2747_c0_g1_i14.p2  ORF type:complete len:291 (+),score=72.38 TRINITY_DN2747_c0_g1_i14:3-875(+)
MGEKTNVQPRPKQVQSNEDPMITLAELKVLAAQLKEDKTYIFAEPSVLYLVDSDGSIKERREPLLLSIRLTENFTAVFSLHEISLSAIYSRKIDESIVFGYDDPTNCFQWMEVENGELELCAAQVENAEILMNFKFFFSRCRMEFSRQEPFEVIFGREEVEWAEQVLRQDYNRQDTRMIIEEELKDAQEIQFEEDLPVNSAVPIDRNEVNRGIVQGKLIDRTFVHKRNGFSVFRTYAADPNTLEVKTFISLLLTILVYDAASGRKISRRSNTRSKKDPHERRGHENAHAE